MQHKYIEENLCLQSLERKERDVIVRLEVNTESDKSLIEQDATKLYEQQLKLLKERHEIELSRYQSLVSKETEISKIYKLHAEQYQKQIDQQQQLISQAFSQPRNLYLDVKPTMNQSQNQSQPSRNIKSNNYREINLHDQSTYVEGDYHNSSNKQNLAEATQEIQQLLQQLEQTYDPETTSGKMQIATEAAKRIEGNPSQMERILSALQTGGVSALEQLLTHPAASFFIAAAQDWQQTATELDNQNTD